jgi:NB-ARC domain
MGLLPLDLVRKRVETSRGESKSALFHDLLHLAEAFLKTYTAAVIAGLPDDPDRHRYRLCHKLLRAASIGEWDEVLADTSTGPASQHLVSEALPMKQELSHRYGRGSWPYDAAALIHPCLKAVMPAAEPLPARAEGRRWFTLLVQLRNKTKHGAITNELIAKILPDLEQSIRVYVGNSVVTQLPWAFLKRNLSGKYHVVNLCSRPSPKFEKLRGDRTVNLSEGVYVDLGDYCRVELIETSVDLTEFYYPNGHFRGRNAEWLSYISGTRKDIDSTRYIAPPTALPVSSTQGATTLDVVGRCFANLPPEPQEYIAREELEQELIAVLRNDRHPVVTLVGRGGIGKTSLALRVLHEVANSEDRFIGIVWLSARDIDLLPTGPKVVRPAVLTTKDIARDFADLLQPKEMAKNDFDPKQYLSECLGKSPDGPLLLVFDNFETIQQPVDVFNWLDTYVRPPNKILITTRHRDFKGDYAVEVGGMTEFQCDQLVRKIAASISMGAAVTQEFLRDVYRESEGHPYVVGARGRSCKCRPVPKS